MRLAFHPLTPDVIAAEWNTFAGEAEAMMPRLAIQVRGENQLLYAEALHRGIIEAGRPVLHGSVWAVSPDMQVRSDYRFSWASSRPTQKIFVLALFPCAL